MPPSNTATKPCSACGKEATKACTGCRRVAYCNISCQKSNWKEHKKVCFPLGATCTRCCEVLTESNADQCIVPHPVHLSVDQGGTMGYGGNTWMFSCEACGEHYKKSSSEYNVAAAPITGGPKFCYSGPHTIKPLPESDQRRISSDIMVINSGPNCQSEIDNIPNIMPDVRVLTIRNTTGYDESIQPTLNLSLPKLKTLKLIDVCFSKVNLNKEMTPSIEELFMQNIPDECDVTVKLPKLKDFSMHYYSADDGGWVHDMLATATKLERFESYKFRVYTSELRFASNDLRYIRLHRAECLESLSIYAPKLEYLNLQACYGMRGHLSILETHPNFTRPPGNPSSFVVDVTNACISTSILHTLQSNSRITYEGYESDDDYY